MDNNRILAPSSFYLPQPFPETFEDGDISKILEAILNKIDVPFKKSQPVPKTIFLDFFGTQKAGKTKTTEKIEQVFRRHKFNLFCPPETAEIGTVRNKISDIPSISQAIHLTGVQDYVLNLAHHPRYHTAIISRGLIDMLYWYERDRRKGNYSDTYCQSINGHIYELLRMDLVDAFILFTCSVEAAMKREYEEALTQKRGSKMNEKDVAETLDIYNTVLEAVDKNVPGLPIFKVDTSELDVRGVGQEVLRFLLPTICRRFLVPVAQFMPYSPRLMQNSARSSGNFEEQLKLKGHPSRETILHKGWVSTGALEQDDLYLNPNRSAESDLGEILRIRKDGKSLRFVYKGQARDRMLSHRHPLSFHIEPEEADQISKAYPVILSIKKSREGFRLNRSENDNHFFTLHIDTIEGLGNFTEIRAFGSAQTTHTEELLNLASELGFSLADIIEGSYLSLALKNKKSHT